MSLVTLIRDYVDVANSSEQLDGYTLSSLAYSFFVFLFTVIKQAFVYCFTFHWLRDLSYFCLTPPTLLSSFGNVNSQQPLSNLLAFSDSHLPTSFGIIFIGFFNGCFSCLHLSAANLITIRRMLVQGVPAGFCSALGTAIGQFSFLVCVLFGFRGILFPWLALEPLHFLLGTGILLIVASAAAQDRRTPTVQWSAKSSLFVYAMTSVLLTWCEQAALFQWMGNISVGIEPTFLETSPFFGTGNTVFENIQQLAQNSSYLLAFFLGNLVGALSLGLLLQRLLELILRSRGIPIYYGLVKQANLPLATLMFAFGFGSLPYYGIDYLMTNGFGFVPNEHLFRHTFFSPVNLVSKTSQMKDSSQGRLEDQLALLFTLEGERTKSFAVDTTPFDDGQYLKINQKRPQTFEDLNYRGEHLWTNRLSRISNMREQANQTQSSFLGPIFSWMRAFLWGDGSTSDLNSPSKRETVEPNFTDHLGQPGGEQTQRAAEKAFRSPVDHFKQKKELSFDREQMDNYVKDFDKQFDKGFSMFSNADPQSLIEVEDQWQEKRIKEKCYTNPIYTFLLNTEIDAFLKRQPNDHWLSPTEEAVLLNRRQLLSTYYDTLALTNQVSASEALSHLVPKSYANAIYNHQFKGTLKVARRLFSVKRGGGEVNTKSLAMKTAALPLTSEKIGGNNQNVSSTPSNPLSQKTDQVKGIGKQALNPEGDKNKRYEVQGYTNTTLNENDTPKVLKFDQPLFSRGEKNSRQILYHEELNGGLMSNQFQQNGELSSKYENESLPLGTEGSAIKENNTFLLKQSSPLPLYAGWDEQLRKLLLTNRFQSRIRAGYTVFNSSEKAPSELTSTDTSDTIFSASQGKEYSGKTLRAQKNKVNQPNLSTSSTIFTTWPLPSPLFDNVQVRQTAGDTNISSSQTNTVAKKAFSNFLQAPTTLLKNSMKFIHKHLFDQNASNQFLFRGKSSREPITNDMVNALLQWQKLINENKQLSKEDKQAAREKVFYWPENVSRANWSTDMNENDLEFDELSENTLKKQILLWEFTPPNHGGFIWPGKM